ncbi:hypothetical protein RRG08_030750 [Elysia crispata]|uniref:Uncharacterized protein n=1 Tax=Elysia crispata TaxID=231223 RepID=A0AAE0YFN4_9GAST|nr:hypothetical protein RRG08_030750 [Elysia crispata]
MVTKLRASVRFRSSAGATHSAETETDTRDVDLNNVQAFTSEEDPGREASETKSSRQTNRTKTFKRQKQPSSEKEKQLMLSNREAQVVRAVILVAAVFVTCQTPLMAYTLARRFESQFDGNEQEGDKVIKVPKAIVTFISFFISLLLLRIPVFMTKRIVREFDPILNTTQVVYRELDDGGLSEKLHDIMNRNILNWASIVIVIACLVVMVTKLRASVRFRSSAGGSHSTPTHTANIIDTSGVDPNNTTTIASNRDKAQPLEHNGCNVQGSLRSDNAAANHKVDRQQATGNQTSKPINSFKTNQTTLLKGRKLASSQK